MDVLSTLFSLPKELIRIILFLLDYAGDYGNALLSSKGFSDSLLPGDTRLIQDRLWPDFSETRENYFLEECDGNRVANTFKKEFLKVRVLAGKRGPGVAGAFTDTIDLVLSAHGPFMHSYMKMWTEIKRIGNYFNGKKVGTWIEFFLYHHSKESPHHVEIYFWKKTKYKDGKKFTQRVFTREENACKTKYINGEKQIYKMPPSRRWKEHPPIPKDMPKLWKKFVYKTYEAPRVLGY